MKWREMFHNDFSAWVERNDKNRKTRINYLPLERSKQVKR